jgi:hypothetical protein
MVEWVLMATLPDLITGLAVSGSENPGLSQPFHLRSTFEPPLPAEVVRLAWLSRPLPDELRVLWGTCGELRLFEDQVYGQWGLVVLDARTCREQTERNLQDRPHEFRTDDLVLGTFLGDLDLLVYARSEGGTRKVLVALPLDRREDWYGVGTTLADFLEKYIENRGRKFWESP